MPPQEYIYQDRAVVFVDVLGFQKKLFEFEKDAETKKDEEGAEYLVSEKVNDFINTFKSVISILEKDNFRYYLFSDNICITVDYVENPDLLISVLFTVSELFYSFAQKGYFLRGGIDIGKFVDEEEIAIGVPLANAYLMENKLAVYPRVLISDKYVKIVEEFSQQGKFDSFEFINIKHLIYDSCELHYINILFNAITKEDKIKFFSDFRDRIKENLEANAKDEKIFVKYEWLANEYNNFLALYTSTLIFKEEDEPTQELIEQLNSLNI